MGDIGVKYVFHFCWLRTDIVTSNELLDHTLKNYMGKTFVVPAQHTDHNLHGLAWTSGIRHWQPSA